jgi:hypothetical protein
MTSKAAVARFFQALNADVLPTPAPRTETERERAMKAASARLEAVGA